jgi:hypothetical protein
MDEKTRYRVLLGPSITAVTVRAAAQVTGAAMQARHRRDPRGVQRWPARTHLDVTVHPDRVCYQQEHIAPT